MSETQSWIDVLLMGNGDKLILDYSRDITKIEDFTKKKPGLFTPCWPLLDEKKLDISLISPFPDTDKGYLIILRIPGVLQEDKFKVHGFHICRTTTESDFLASRNFISSCKELTENIDVSDFSSDAREVLEEIVDLIENVEYP